MKIRDIILWILFLTAIFVSLWYIFGNSPSFEQALIVLVISLLFAVYAKISDMSSRIVVLEKSFFNMESSFKRLILDFRETMGKKR